MQQKLHLKKQFRKTAAATGDLIGNTTADKITSIGKPKEKKKQIINDLRLFQMLQRN